MKLFRTSLLNVSIALFGLSYSIVGYSEDTLSIAPEPLIEMRTVDVKPNIMFVLDDSGSMVWTHMPGGQFEHFGGAYGHQSSRCNAIYYDPNITYTAPYNPNQTGSSFPDMTDFTRALHDGYNANEGTANLNNGFVNNRYEPQSPFFTDGRQWNGTINGTTNNGGYRNPMAAQSSATYYTYNNPTPTVIDYNFPVNYNNDGGNGPVITTNAFMTECSTPIQNFVQVGRTRQLQNGTVFQKRRVADTMSTTIQVVGSGTASVSSITVNGYNLLSAATNASSNAGTVARRIRDAINAVNDGYTAVSNGSTVTITGPESAAGYWPQVTATAKDFEVDVFPDSNTASNGGLGASTNFANWYSYYRTRMLMMKTSVALAFKDIDDSFRVGFATINTPTNQDFHRDLEVFGEQGGVNHKNNWYQFLANIQARIAGTPLRTALSTMGRMYAKKQTSAFGDPMEYACQANYSLLTTDGYWNDSNNSVVDIDNSQIGNLDGSGTPRPQFEGPTGTSTTLADVAKYYKDTDIRDGGFNNCTSSETGEDVCGTAEQDPDQNMITLTLGLGADGTLTYDSDYKTQTTGDYIDIVNNNNDWPVPVANTATTIDDLWHAAVNGGGTYYSAKNPETLKDALIRGLAEIQANVGAGSAAAASNLSPVAGDNFAYVAGYRTGEWSGNLEARAIDTSTLDVSRTATWCVENVPAGECTNTETSSEVVTANGASKFYCVTPNANTNNCTTGLGIGNNPTGCYREVSNSCTGSLKNQVDTNSRSIFMSQGGTAVPFTPTNVTGNIAYTSALDTGLQNLSQWTDIKDNIVAGGVTLENDPNRINYLIDYLRGQATYEDQSSNTIAANRLFRDRAATLGDITGSTPIYIGRAELNYADPGFADFADAVNSSGNKAIVVGANDGMLHMFNAANGNEHWAFIPREVVKNLPALADKAYGKPGTDHKYYVNGSAGVFAICTSACRTESAVWRSILVSGLNAGGRGYFAMDVTNPTTPQLLWEFGATENQNIGLSYGNPLVVKLGPTAGSNAGKWVVLLTSGYNNGTYEEIGTGGANSVLNSPQGDGQGRLFVLDAYTGALIRTINTRSGTGISPSGLAKITARVTDGFRDATVQYVYGGDLDGNLWRFDPNNGDVIKLTQLTDGSAGQPITTAPEIGLSDRKPLIMVGTGKYIERDDLTDTQTQTIYAIKDNNITATIGNIRSQLIGQPISVNGQTRTVNEQSIGSSLGWYVDFTPGERVNIEPKLVNGVLLMPTTVPDSSACAGGGYGWFNYFNYKTGGSVIPGSDIVSERLDSPSVGFNLIYPSDGSGPVVTNVSSKDPTPTKIQNSDVADGGGQYANSSTLFKQGDSDAYGSGTYGRRSVWRELIKSE